MLSYLNNLNQYLLSSSCEKLITGEKGTYPSCGPKQGFSIDLL